MQKLVGMVRRCVEDYEMIRPGDRVAVGVSGGKDSLTLLAALAKLREFYPKPFTVEAITLDMGHADGRESADFSRVAEAVTIDMGMGMDYSGVRRLCDRLEIPYTIVPTQIGPIIFDYRKEQNPCSMCAKMRRGALSDLCRELGANKLALGHHRDDALETLLMSVLSKSLRLKFLKAGRTVRMKALIMR